MQYRYTLLDMVGSSFEAEECAIMKNSYESNTFVLEPCTREHQSKSLLKSTSKYMWYCNMHLIYSPLIAGELHRNCMS